MKRRDFLKTNAALGAMVLSGAGMMACTSYKKPVLKFPRYRGFNLLAKFSAWGPRRRFEEEDSLFANCDHLNRVGAKKFTEILIKDIIRVTGISAPSMDPKISF